MLELKPTVIDDSRMLLAGTSADAFRSVRLGKYCRLHVIAPGADGALRVVRTLATTWSPSPDLPPAPNDQSGTALATLAGSYRLQPGEAYALRLLR
jgi:hypothetical protein